MHWAFPALELELPLASEFALDRVERERPIPDRILDLLLDLRRRNPRERTRIELSALKQRP